MSFEQLSEIECALDVSIARLSDLEEDARSDERTETANELRAAMTHLVLGWGIIKDHIKSIEIAAMTAQDLKGVWDDQ